MNLLIKCDILGIECEGEETSKYLGNQNRLRMIILNIGEMAMKHWSTSHQQQIQMAIETARANSITPFAVFDADNTIWKHDIEEALLAWLEFRGLLHLKDLPESILPLPIRAEESVFSYYQYLSEIDHSICYLWACQAFSGFSLNDIHNEIKQMFSFGSSIPIPRSSRTVPIPQIYPAQLQLIKHLTEAGIRVWVVSASLEEIVRMVICDPDNGLPIPPHQVIGVNLLLKHKEQHSAGCFDRQRGMNGSEHFFSPDRMTFQFTEYPLTPLTWYAGKVAAIKTWIHPNQRPMLVAGDSPNDFHMQFYAAAEGVRLRIHLSAQHKNKLEEEKQRRSIPNSSDENVYSGWLEVTPDALGIPD